MNGASAPSTASAAGAFDSVRRWFASNLPRGGPLPNDVWWPRHRLVMALLLSHAMGVLTYGLLAGVHLGPLLWFVSLILGCAALAYVPLHMRIVRSVAGATGLIICSAAVVHLSGGVIEMHFHFFVALAIITLYQEWQPFLAAILVILLHHGIGGMVDPESVYAHAAGAAHPWRWAWLHLIFVIAACAAYAIQWRSNEQLREHAAALLDAAGEGVLGVGSNGRVAFANPKAGELLGARPELLVGRPVAAILPGLQVEAASGQGKMSTGARIVQEADAVTRTGSSLPVECVVTPLHRGGEVDGQVITFNDISGRRRFEREQLRERDEQVKRLRALDELKTQFLNTAAHELRTPLMPLGLQLEILQMRASQPGAGAPDEASLDVLRRNFERLQRLVDDMLSVAQLDAGRISLRREPLALRPAIDEAVAAFQPLADKRGVQLSVECPERLWVDADPLRFNQVLMNLLSNAVRYTPPGGRVDVIVVARNGSMAVRVQDTGAGLSRQQIEGLFRPFGQVHEGLSAQESGTGLGLYISKALVELHGGRIWADSAGPGKGATFTFTMRPIPEPTSRIHAIDTPSPVVVSVQ